MKKLASLILQWVFPITIAMVAFAATSTTVAHADFQWTTRINIAESGSDNVGYRSTVSGAPQHGWTVMLQALYEGSNRRRAFRSVMVRANGTIIPDGDNHVRVLSNAPVDNPDIICSGINWFDRYDVSWEAEESITVGGNNLSLTSMQFLVRSPGGPVAVPVQYKLKRALNMSCCDRSFSSCSGCSRTSVPIPPNSGLLPHTVTINTSGQCG